MKIKAIITTSILMLFIISFSQSQNIAYANSLSLKVKTQLGFLYPHATGRVIFNDKYVSDTTQELEIKCNCPEFSGKMIIQFDTNGVLLNKDFCFDSLKGLPSPILSYIKKNISETIRIDNGYMVKNINNKGEVSYSIRMLERSTTAYQSTERYILRFKSTGEFISKEKVPDIHD